MKNRRTSRSSNMHIKNPKPKKQKDDYVYDPTTLAGRKRRQSMKDSATRSGQKGLEEYLPVRRIDETEFDDRTAVGTAT